MAPQVKAWFCFGPFVWAVMRMIWIACCKCMPDYLMWSYLLFSTNFLYKWSINFCQVQMYPDIWMWYRNLHQLLKELLAIANVTKGKQEIRLDLLPVGEDFDPTL